MNGVTWRRAPRIAVDTVRVWYHAASYLAAGWLPRTVSRFPRSGAPHLVLLARHLPPTIAGGAYRSLALMGELARRGWRITALSGPGSGAAGAAGPELHRRIPPDAELSAWQRSSLDVSRHASPSLDGGFTEIRQIIDAALTATGNKAPSLVHATGPTFAEFIAAMVLARHWKVPYSLDYRDEWSGSPFEFVKRGNSDRFWEDKVLRHASLVTYTTEGQRDHQLRAFPHLDHARTAVVRNGWDAEASRDADAREVAGTGGRARICYLGSLGEHCDVPEFLATLRGALDAHAELRTRMVIHFVGAKNQVEGRLLSGFDIPDVVRDVPQVPLTTAQAMMRRSRALLAFNPPRLARCIPGKTYEYIASGNRILLYGEGGELQNLLSEYPPAIPVPRGNSEALSQALWSIATSSGEAFTDASLAERYSTSRRAAEHVNLFERIIEAARGNEAASPPRA